MDIVWRLLATVLGIFGGLSVILFIKRLAAGEDASPAPVLIGLATISLAWACMRKADSGT